MNINIAKLKCPFSVLWEYWKPSFSKCKAFKNLGQNNSAYVMSIFPFVLNFQYYKLWIINTSIFYFIYWIFIKYIILNKTFLLFLGNKFFFLLYFCRTTYFNLQDHLDFPKVSGSLRVGYDWATSLSLFDFIHWRRKWQPTPVFLSGESQGQGSLVGCRLWGSTELDTTEAT